MDKFRSQASDSFDLFQLGVQLGGGLEFKLLGGCVALLADVHEIAFTVSGEEATDGFGFFAVAGVGAGLLAGGEAHLHLAVDAAGMGGVGVQVFFAAAEKEELQQLVGIAFGGGAGGKWTEGPLRIFCAGLVGYGEARVSVAAVELDECRRAQMHPFESLCSVDVFEQSELD